MLTTIARRAEDLITAKLRQDAAASERIAPVPGGPIRAEIGRWGRTVGMRVPALSELAPYNKARGVNEDDLRHLGAMTAFFTDAGIVPTLEVWAGDASDRLGATLARAGLYAGVVTATLHRPLNPRLAEPPSGAGHLAVEELGPADDGTEYLATLVGGYGLTGARPERLAMLRAEHDPAAVRRYLVRVNGRPAAAAGLYAGPDGVLLSGAAALPEYRGRGCQTALIARRLADAARHADLAVVTVARGSPSHANLERSGFRLTHTRTAWRPR